MTPEAAALCVRWMPYVWAWTRRTIGRFPSLRATATDVAGDGMVALVEAAIDFDPGRGVPFPGLLKVRLRAVLSEAMSRRRPLGYRGPAGRGEAPPGSLPLGDDDADVARLPARDGDPADAAVLAEMAAARLPDYVPEPVPDRELRFAARFGVA